MRIKSYFAASVQAAIAIARREFGDGVTLVTSHAAAPDSRHLGEYEVVFAIEDEQVKATPDPVAPTPVAEKPAEPEFTGFQQALMQAVVQQNPVALGEPAKLQKVRELLVELHLDAAMVSAVMTIVEQACGKKTEAPPVRCEQPIASAPAIEPLPIVAAPAPAPKPVPAPKPAPGRPAITPTNGGLSAAELAFILSVEEQPSKQQPGNARPDSWARTSQLFNGVDQTSFGCRATNNSDIRR